MTAINPASNRICDNRAFSRRERRAASEGITIHYKGCQLAEGMRNGRPLAYVHRKCRLLARIGKKREGTNSVPAH